MPPSAPQTVEILHPENVGAARRTAQGAAESLGFAAQAGEEIALVVMELATNLLKHAGGGRLVLTPLTVNGRIGLQIESLDRGPGIADIDQALADGYSTSSSLGNGLGAINRLMDELELESSRRGGTHIVCRKWVRTSAISHRSCPLSFGAASRPHPKEEINGDAFVIKLWDGMALAGIIDGVGHGEFARRAAYAARHYIETHFDLPLSDLFRGVGRACRATRGVVMSLARFDWEGQRVALAAVGNVEVRAFNCSPPLRLAVRRGIIGVQTPNPLVTEHPWLPGQILVLHSDGLSTRWQWTDFPELAGESATVIAQRLLRALAKENDDATVMVVRDRER